MQVVQRAEQLAPAASQRVLVPTMGALHAGHLSLVRKATEAAGEEGVVVVSVFVNPTQFNDPADLERYPRTLEADVEALREVGADVVFAPPVEEVYPDGPLTEVPLPPVATEPKLEDAHRPGHFAGVCQVVARLFELVRPAKAVFGEKDWQQLRVVEAMSERDGLGVEIVAGPTVRERDGLAMSSRNTHLSSEGRRRAPALFAALREASLAKLAGAGPDEAEGAMRRVLGEAGVEIDYAAVRDARTLVRDASTDWRGSPMRSILAGRIDGVRLLDNAPW